MANLSLREHLSKIGEPKPGKAFRLVRNFYVLPPSRRLRDMMRAMLSPQPSQWTKPNEGKFLDRDSDHGWTTDCQGVTHDDNFWYISSDHAHESGIHTHRKRVYRLSLSHVVDGHVDVADSGSEHLGAIDYYKGRIYCAMERPVQILIIDTPPFTEWKRAALVGEENGPAPQDSCPWCAINPWNGLLYSSNNGHHAPGEDTLRAYRFDKPSSRFMHVPTADIVLSEKIRKIQGAVFSKNGHALLASDHSNDIRCYSVLNGQFLGRAAIRENDSFFVQEEVEGLTIWEGVSYEGIPTHVHVILLDNDLADRDDVFFKHYQVPLAEYL